MCSYFLKNMESNNNYQGDLADIFHVSTTTTSSDSWQFPINFSIDPTSSHEDFGHPFTHFRDPLLMINNTLPSVLHDQDIGNSLGFANHSNDNNYYGSSSTTNNSFSRMLQISHDPNTISSAHGHDQATKASTQQHMLVTSTTTNKNNHALISSQTNSSKGCLLLESPAGNLQISPPRNTGIKRRKGQAKKVVCIPAPAPANSRSTGEIVPSDLWAWRKYGQKPIKGSPHPRGYYRCSSSKGCLARKQVERSRNDPNMLVITYTSEHNHPWPTQRNALAGSSRSQQPSRNSTTTSKNSPNSPTKKSSKNPNEQEHKTIINTVITTHDDLNSASVKEEIDQHFDNNQIEMDDSILFDEGFSKSYKPTLMLDSYHSDIDQDSFFAGLGEIEGDPLDFLFDGAEENKGMDPFSFYDWATNTNNIMSSSITTSTTSATTSYGGDTCRDY